MFEVLMLRYEACTVEGNLIVMLSRHLPSYHFDRWRSAAFKDSSCFLDKQCLFPSVICIVSTGSWGVVGTTRCGSRV